MNPEPATQASEGAADACCVNPSDDGAGPRTWCGASLPSKQIIGEHAGRRYLLCVQKCQDELREDPAGFLDGHGEPDPDSVLAASEMSSDS